MTRDILLSVSVFFASLVESVEALTIVLAVGITRGWRSTLYGMYAALAALSALVTVFGPALSSVPIQTLRLIVGTLLLIFGLQWLRKAIFRSSGFKPLHDETKIYQRATAEAEHIRGYRRRGIVNDWYSFTIAFKGVLLEGLEVVFIVITFGANQGNIPLAVVAGATAILIVAAAGLAVQRPLARVPENTLKFVVGIMLTSFGIFWGSEGVGIRWPGGDAALIGVVIFVLVTSLIQIRLFQTLYSKIESNTK